MGLMIRYAAGLDCIHPIVYRKSYTIVKQVNFPGENAIDAHDTQCQQCEYIQHLKIHNDVSYGLVKMMTWSQLCYSGIYFPLTHLPLVSHIWVNELGEHWFR